MTATELSSVSEKSSLGGLARKLLQLEGGCHRRVVGRDILLPLDRILPYGGKSVYTIDVADELRKLLAAVVPYGKVLHAGEGGPGAGEGDTPRLAGSR
jgi:hypothetical protein